MATCVFKALLTLMLVKTCIGEPVVCRNVVTYGICYTDTPTVTLEYVGDQAVDVDVSNYARPSASGGKNIVLAANATVYPEKTKHCVTGAACNGTIVTECFRITVSPQGVCEYRAGEIPTPTVSTIQEYPPITAPVVNEKRNVSLTEETSDDGESAAKLPKTVVIILIVAGVSIALAVVVVLVLLVLFPRLKAETGNFVCCEQGGAVIEKVTERNTPPFNQRKEHLLQATMQSDEGSPTIPVISNWVTPCQTSTSAAASRVWTPADDLSRTSSVQGRYSDHTGGDEARVSPIEPSRPACNTDGPCQDCFNSSQADRRKEQSNCR